MAIGMKTMGWIIAVFGVKSFVHGIVAEHKKPASGHPHILTEVGRVICNYPSDPSIVLGFLSIASLAISILVGFYSLFYPYKGKSVSRSVFFRSMAFFVFFLITLALSMLAAGMLASVTITELLHLTNNVHRDMKKTCPTAKTGLFGGAAFMALNAAFFWLICLMLADDVRKDYFKEQEDSQAQLLTTDVDAKQQIKV